MFNQAHHFLVNGGNYNQTIHIESGETGLLMLSQAISMGAMHDSSERDPPPICHPETRKQVVEDILSWVHDPDPLSDVMWLHAPFGHGKSAIMQTIAESLQDLGFTHLFAGAFFFGRNKPGRDKPHYVIPTIAHQIARNIPGMREHINHAMQLDPSIPYKSLEIQLRSLLVVPFQNCSAGPYHTPTVIIDGLDECDTPNSQRAFLKMIATAISSYHVPLRFLVASRPEVHLLETFAKMPLSVISSHLHLDDDYFSYDEMTVYMQSGFDKICDERDDVMSSIQRPWPDKKDFSKLINNASGQFLYSSTVLAFVGSEYHHPVKQLQIILDEQSIPRNAFSNMDILLTQILEMCPDKELLLRILGVLLLPDWKSLAAIGDILCISPDDVRLALRPINALIDRKELPVPAHYPLRFISRFTSPSIQIYHTSFREFLGDQRRSKAFYIDTEKTSLQLSIRADELLVQQLECCISTGPPIHDHTWNLTHTILQGTAVDNTHEDLPLLLPRAWWPRLRHFMDERLQRNTSISAAPSHGFFGALYSISSYLERIITPSNGLPHESILSRAKSYKIVCDNMLDQGYQRSATFSAATSLVISTLIGPSIWIDRSADAVSERTSLPLTTIFDVLENNSFMFFQNLHGKSEWIFDLPQSYWIINLKSNFRDFLEDETRSGILHVAYRELVILKFAEVVLSYERISESPLTVIWTAYDLIMIEKVININLAADSRQDSAMRILFAVIRSATLQARNVVFTYELLTLLSRQRRIIRDSEIALGVAELSILNDQEQALDRVVESQFLRDTFTIDIVQRTFQWPPERISLTDVSVHPQAKEDSIGCVNAVLSIAHIYELLSQIWKDSEEKFERMPSANHTIFLEFFTHVLVCCVFQQQSDNFGGVYPTILDIMIKTVRWKDHLSRATFSKRILLRLITFHYISTKPDYFYARFNTSRRDDTLDKMPTEFYRGVLGWLKARSRRYPDLEDWYEQLDQKKEEQYVK